MKRRIVLLGPPASGKGTQAEMIKTGFQIATASPGAMLREEKRTGTPIGIEADRLTSKGNLVPDDMVVELVESWLGHHDSAFVFDGFPRTLGQADKLEGILHDRATPLDLAFSFDVDFETIRDRVLRRRVCEACGNIVSVGLHVEDSQSPCPRCGGALHQRKDDNVESLSRRMDEYHQKSEPLISYYGERGILKHIDAARKPDAVFASLAAALEA